MSTCLQLADLSKTYRGKAAVDRLSLEVQAGEVFGLLGPNGAGKSTTLYMMAGLVRPTSGAVSIFGKDMKDHFIEIADKIGVLVERPAFFEHLTVEKNLLLHARLAGRDVTIDRALELVGLLGRSDQQVRTLSHGMRQRLGLAHAFLTEPELLILDEPTSGLDAEHTQEVLRLLRLLANDASVTIIISSHMMHEVEVLCDRVAVINEGRLVSCEDTDSLISYDKSVVEVLIDAAEAAAKRLREQDWVESVEVRPTRLVVRLKEPNAHQLNHFLVNAGYQVSGIIPRRRTLQEYFLKALNA